MFHEMKGCRSIPSIALDRLACPGTDHHPAYDTAHALHGVYESIDAYVEGANCIRLCT